MEKSMDIIYQPIGIIHSPFNSLENMPIQPTSEATGSGIVEIFPQFIDGLKDLEGFSHIYLLYYFHKVRSLKLTVIPFLDKEPRGIFATRAPSRPNPIGLSLVELVRIENSFIFVERLDVLNETPLLDVKPYVPDFENTQNVRIGWLEQVKGEVRTRKSDKRFM
jgi:tRNA-Thr(GGU) m(6)t(6)A37 methyltransferase TsaA